MKILDACHLAELAYDDKISVKVKNHLVFDVDLDDAVAVAIAGTNDLLDVAEDISAWPNLKGEHWGFAAAFKDIRPYLDKLVREHKGKKIWWIGHSMGGILAQFAAKKYGGKAITFGSPKGWISLCHPKFDHVRVTMDFDPVTLVPPIGYRHFQTTAVELSTTPKTTPHKIGSYKALIFAQIPTMEA